MERETRRSYKMGPYHENRIKGRLGAGEGTRNYRKQKQGGKWGSRSRPYSLACMIDGQWCY